MKACTKCKVVKELSEFSSSSRFKDGHMRMCKRCRVATRTEWRKANPEKATAERRRDRLRKYGLTVQQYDDLLELQDGRCAICLKDQPGHHGRFVVDHDHLTGVVRGLLCHECNVGVGFFKDSQEKLLAAVAYLRRSPPAK